MSERRVKFQLTLSPDSNTWLLANAKHLDVSPGHVVDLLIKLAIRSRQRPPERMAQIVPDV